MNDNSFRGPRVLAAIMMALFCAGAAAQPLKWSVNLKVQDAGAIEVVVDTTDSPTDLMVTSAKFQVKFFDGQKALVGEKRMAFVDDKLPVLRSGHVYQRDFRHDLVAVQTVEGDTLDWSTPGGDPKADSLGGVVRSVARIEKSPDVKVASGSPKPKVEYARPAKGGPKTGIVQRDAIQEGGLIKGSGPEVFLVVGGSRRWIPDERTFDALGLSWQAISVIPDQRLNGIPRGVNLPSLSGNLVKGSSPAIFLLENGKRRWIPDEQTFHARGLRMEAVQTLPDEALRSIPQGEAIPR